jgi:hypothetical protein
MKRRHDIAYKLRIKRAQANITLAQTSALLGGNPSIFVLHRIETRKQNPTPAQEAVLKAFLRLSPAAIKAKAAKDVGRKGMHN